MDSSRIASFSQGFGLLLLAACAGCSSSSGTDNGGSSGSASGSSSGSGASGSSSGGGGATPNLDGGGAPCPAQTKQTVGVQINLSVTWSATGSINGGSGPYVLWLLSTYAMDASNNITATTRTCQLTTPDIQLNATGNLAEGLAANAMAKVATQSPLSEWEKVTRPSTATGVLGGWNVGSSIYIEPSVTLDGLPESSTYKDAKTKWPPFSSTGYPFGMSQMYTNEEGDSNPGITVIPSTATGYAPIRTGLGSGSNIQPATDKLFIASRTQLSMYGKSKSCTETTGTATVTLIDNHVIGCEIENGGGICSPIQYGYIDSSRTVYVPGSATFTQKVLSDSATCSDVVAALPPPT